MLKNSDKILERIRFILITLIVIKIATAILTVLFIVLFDGHDLVITLIRPYYISLFMKMYAGPIGFWILLILGTLGWPVSIALIINMEEKVWIPYAGIVTLSLIDVCSYTATIIAMGAHFELSIHPQLILALIFNSGIMFLSTSYLIIESSATKQNNQNIQILSE